MTDVFNQRARLTARLQDLQDRLSRISQGLVSHESKDFADLATEREDDEVQEGIGVAGLQEIAQIRAALERIAAGTYGRCTVCGKPIAPARLDAVPFTPFCQDHAHD